MKISDGIGKSLHLLRKQSQPKTHVTKMKNFEFEIIFPLSHFPNISYLKELGNWVPNHPQLWKYGNGARR